MITVRGYSDDTIRLGGDDRQEIYDIDGNSKLTFNDGTVLHVRYHTDVAVLHSATALTKHQAVQG